MRRQDGRPGKSSHAAARKAGQAAHHAKQQRTKEARRERRAFEREREVRHRMKQRCPEPCGKVACHDEDDARWLRAEVVLHRGDGYAVRFYECRQDPDAHIWHWTRWVDREVA